MTLDARHEYRIVVLGAGGVGKSCLTAQFVQNVWIESYDPTIEDFYRKQIEVDAMCTGDVSADRVGLDLIGETDENSLDTAGMEQFPAMRELYMRQGQGFLLVFSLTNRSSFNDLADMRNQIVSLQGSEDVPLVIAGNKADLEEDRDVPKARAWQMSQRWGNTPYYETSARRRIYVDDVFVDLCRQIIRKESREQSRKDREEGTTGKKRERLRDHCVIL